MVDVADLVVQARTDGVDRVAVELKELSTAARGAENSVESLGREARSVTPHMRNMERALETQTRQMKAAQMAGLNMSRQFADVGVSLASGVSPIMVLIQQGPQIADGFAVAGQAGVGFRGVIQSLYASLAPLLPLILGVTAAAAAIAAPFAIGAQQINAANQDLIDGLGLTKDQLENVKNEGVTMGDVLTGTWVVTSKALTDAFGPEIEAVKGFFADLYQRIVDGAVSALKGVVGGFTGAAAAIRATWSIVPSALGDAAVSAANAVLRSIGGMVNNGILALNVLIAAANRAADAIPGVDAFIPFLNPVNVLQLANPFAGALSRVGNEGGEAFAAGFERGAGRVENFLDDVANEAANAARRRILREAGEATGAGARGGSNAREAREVVRFLQEANVQLRDLNVRLPEVLDPLEVLVRELRLVDDLSRRAGQGLAEAFGAPGAALAGITDALSEYRLQLAEINLAERENRLTGAQASRERAAAEIQSFGDMASAAKGFFDERSAGYQTLLAVEQAYRAIQFANSVKALILDKTETGATVAQNAIKAASHGVVAVARAIASLPFPLNLAAGAATAAAIAALGISIAGGGRGGGGSVPALPETNTGTGTVLGDPGAQSESLTRSLEMAERYQNRDLEYSSRMVSSLRSIQDNIGSLTTAIARETGVGGGLNPGNVFTGTTTSGGFLGIGATTRTTDLIDQGINLDSGELADLIARGVSGSLYQLTQTTRTRSGFFGIGGSTRTYTDETNTGIGSDLSQEFARVLESLRNGVLTAAGQLGLTGAEAVLDAFRVNLGRISFEGLSPTEISQTLNAVFSAVGDDMAAAILPGLVAFQQAGEGLFETLSRLATEYRTVDLTLASIGMTFRTVGLESIEARARLVELSGGLEAFVEGTSFFAENFLTDAQRIAPIQAAVTAELERLGIATDITRTGFADLVMGLDVSTEAGAAMYAALISLAPALDRVLTYQEEITGTIVNSAELDRQRRELEIRLMEAQGDTAGALAIRRADELAAMDASLRPLQEAIWAAEDMARAAAELAEAERQAAEAQRILAQQRRDLEIQLMEATGDAAGALAARRELELAALDASLRPLQEAVWAALDLAAANEALAQAQADAAAAAEAEAQRIAQIEATRRNLEIDLLDAQGRSAEAVAARRALELEALDASLRPLQEAIYAALDLAAAAEALAEAERLATEAAQAEADRLAQIATQRRSLEIQLLEATGDAAGALAARRADELAALDASLRPMQEAIWAALDLAEANRQLANAQAQAAEEARQEAERIAAIARQQRELDIQLLEATGDASAALAARRQDELAALDESLRATQLSIWAALDLAAANELAAVAQEEAAEAAARLAEQRRGLEIELLEATGDAAGALAARRADELAALDESLRSIQLAIWAARDLADANEALADAQARAAEEAEREAERLADLARQARGLEIELLEATGNASAALSARRADELAALDESLRSTQLAIWAALDLASANEAAAVAQQEAADAANRLAAQRSSLEIQLLEATGQSVEALARRRQQELDQLDESLRPIQLQIYAAQDLAEAQALAAERQAGAARAAEEAARAYAEMQQDAINRVDQARDALTGAYEREAGALRDTIDTFRDFGASIRAFRAGLDTAEGAGGSYAASRSAFEQTAALARLGNQEALGNLTGASQTFLDAALNNASSAAAYNRDVGLVKAALDAAAGTADRNVTVAEQQLAALDASVSGLITLNESVLSVRDGITALQAAIFDARRLGVTQFAEGGVFTSPTMFRMGGSLGQLGEAGPEAIMPLVSGPNGLGVRSTGDSDVVAELRALRQEMAELKAASVQTTANTGRTARASERHLDLFDRVSDGGEAVITEAAA
jgi:hypothetical protein